MKTQFEQMMHGLNELRPSLLGSKKVSGHMCPWKLT